MGRVSIPVLANRGCTVLFLLPFAGFGVFMFVKGFRSLAKADIEKVDIDIATQSGDRACYRVKLHLGGRKTRDIATGIRDKNEARWLASVLESYLEAQ